MFTIFAVPNIPEGEKLRLLATGFFYARLQTIYGFVPPCWSVNAPTALWVLGNGKGGTVFYFCLINNISEMPNTENNCLNVNNSTVPATSAHETCAKFITILQERFPQLKKIKCKISNNGKHLTLRASYKRRRIHADGFDFERTMNTFLYYMILKLVIDTYYPTIEEMREKRPLEPFVENCYIPVF